MVTADVSAGEDVPKIISAVFAEPTRDEGAPGERRETALPRRFGDAAVADAGA